MKYRTSGVLLGASALVTLGAAWTSAGPTREQGEVGACCAEAGSAGAEVVVRHGLTLEGANRVLGAAVAEAKRRSAGGAIAVVDEGGGLVAFQRIDGTFAAGAEVSIGKARTSAIFKRPTKAFEDAINNGRYALAAAPTMTPLQGGVPIVHEGHVVGAIGVSGAHSQVEDEEIALAGAAAITPGSR